MNSRALARFGVFLPLLPALWFLSGCVAPPAPTNMFVRTGPSYSATIPKVSQVGLVSDATLVYDGVGSDYFTVEDSRVAAAGVLREAKQSLEAKGYQIAFADTPFIGAFKNPQPMAVAERRTDKSAQREPPFFVADSVARDEPFRKALHNVIAQTVHALEQRGELPTDKFRSVPGISESLGVVADRYKIDHLLVIVGNGTIVSGGKQTGQMLGTSLLSSVMTLGMVTVSRHNVSFLDSYLGLIDLKTGEILWSNSLRLTQGNPGNQSFYKGNWSRNLLFHFPHQGTVGAQSKSTK